MIRYRVPALATILLASACVSGCSMAPHYERLALAAPAAFKEAPGWRTAQPADDIAKGEWWRLFDDPILDALEARVAVTNQNVAAAAAAYAEARAATREAKAAAYPSISLSGSGTNSGSFGSQTPIVLGGGSSVGGSNLGSLTNDLLAAQDHRYSLSLGATWEPDLWGKIRSTVRQASATAQASQADLANATLSAQGELASDYLQLRAIEAQKKVLDDTVGAYAHALTVTRNRLIEGVAAEQDVLLAEAQLRDARAQDADLDRQRAIYEHAIAVLVGDNPSSFSIAPAAWNAAVPAIPSVLPSALLERRPDVASAERKVAAANANIGIQKAAFFPTISLSASLGGNGSDLGSLFTASGSLWSLGAQVAETVFDFGARTAKVKQARAAYDQTVAQYRQTALTAFQQTEDALAATRVLATVSEERSAGATASSGAAALAFNQYLAGQIDYTQVVTTQAAALSAQQARIAAIANQQAAAVSLIQAIGGTWLPAR